MILRARSVSGLIALFALFFSFAEGVWAASCVPGMEMDSAGESTADMMVMVGGESTPAPPGDDPSRRDTGDPDCPFGPIASTQSCTVSASMPATIVAFDPAQASASFVATAFPTFPNGLRTSSIFHPPKS